ncbi:unnamed protein product [Euphydryas editha]|uniref:Uncharacterized protein n=1 Tax=Euphydryas editha TaxID=104508 RepID=A0AAU9VBZ3_EUPED|nr:unnamed protein product [Euphydryas editha]
MIGSVRHALLLKTENICNARTVNKSLISIVPTYRARNLSLCPKCLIIKQRRRVDNTNTPIWQAPTTRSATNTTISDDVNDHTSSNITLRTKLSKSDTTSPYVTEERLRHTLRQEIADVLQTTLHDLVTKELTSINQQFSSFHESLNFFNDYFENFKKELEEKSATIKILQTDNANL